MLKLDTNSPFGYLLPKMYLGFAEEGSGDKVRDEDTGDSDKGAKDWRTSLPDEVKNHPIMQKYKTPGDMAKALIEVQPLIGADKIIMPSKDAKEEEWNERVFDRLGRPKTATEYALPTDIEIPKELPVDEKLITGFKETAHKLGVLPHQAAGLYKWFMTSQIDAFNNATTSRKTVMSEAETSLRRRWGAAYDQNVGLARKVINKFASPQAVEMLVDGLGNDPRVIELFSEIGKVLSEDQLVGKPKGLTLTPEEAQAELKKMEADLKGPLYDANHVEHKATVEKRDMLYRLAYPEG